MVQLFCVFSLIAMTPFFAAAQDPSEFKEKMNSDLIETVRNTLSNEKSNVFHLPTSDKEEFLRKTEELLSHKDYMVNGYNKKVILDHIPVFMTLHLNPQTGQVIQQQDQNGILKIVKKIVPTDPIEQRSKMALAASELVAQLERSLKREEVVPSPERQSKIIQQKQELEEFAVQLIQKQLNDVPEEMIQENVKRVFDRLTPKMQDPFSDKGKRLLDDSEITQIKNQWGDQFSVYISRSPFQRRIADDRMKEHMHRSIVLRLAAQFYRDLTHLY